jgi:hypothetical protein
MTQLAFHPLANVFPLLAGEEFDALVADIQASGLRYRACQALGLDCATRDYLGNNPLAFVLIPNPINSCANGSGIPNLRQMPWSRMHKDSWELV